MAVHPMPLERVVPEFGCHPTVVRLLFCIHHFVGHTRKDCCRLRLNRLSLSTCHMQDFRPSNDHKLLEVLRNTYLGRGRSRREDHFVKKRVSGVGMLTALTQGRHSNVNPVYTIGISAPAFSEAMRSKVFRNRVAPTLSIVNAKYRGLCTAAASA